VRLGWEEAVEAFGLGDEVVFFAAGVGHFDRWNGIGQLGDRV
jgi:hypothetical protein